MVRPYEDSDESDDENDEHIIELVNLMKSKGFVSNKGKYRKPRDMKDVQCYHCKNFGHYKNRCPDLNENRSLPTGEGEVQRKG